MASGSIPVLRLHYSADPRKRPGTLEGDAWMAEAESGYPGGRKSPRWQQELEIVYGAMSGVRLFPDWESWKPRLVIPPFSPRGWRFYGSYDHGWRNPASFHVHAISPEGEIVTAWEFYADKVPVHQIAKLIQGHDIVVPYRPDAKIEPTRTRWDGCPFASDMTWKVADPSMWAQDQVQTDNTNKSIADLFLREGVVFLEGQRGGDTMVAEWLMGHYWRELQAPRYRIFDTCPWLIWELGQLRHKQISAQVAVSKDQPEQLVDKDNHAWDDLKMFLQRFPPAGQTAKPQQIGGTFEWFRKQAKAAKDGQPVRTFRREMIG